MLGLDAESCEDCTMPGLDWITLINDGIIAWLPYVLTTIVGAVAVEMVLSRWRSTRSRNVEDAHALSQEGAGLTPSKR
jgi:hypothetical protein